jgi:predicted transposase YdaD
MRSAKDSAGGRRQGRQEGRQEGGAEVLAAVLAKRFGPLDGAVAQRLAAANVKQLSAWALNAVAAESLAEVFGD